MKLLRLGEPHGGRLVDRRVDTRKRERLIEEAKECPRIMGNERILSDVWQIATGGFSPIEGFLTQAEYESVVKEFRLTSGLLWSLPIVLPIDDNLASEVNCGDVLAIFDETNPVALVRIEEIFKRDKKLEMDHIFGTRDLSHPGVQKLVYQPNSLIGGKIDVINRPKSIIPEKELEPRETRREFERRGWKTIVAFQTRNIPHMAHEYLQRIGLEIADGLFIHPIIGERKSEDFPPWAIIESYEWVVNNLYPKDRVFLSFLWTWMYFAGPREALHHCLLRKNYGATHIIIGRLHAAHSGYYSEYAAHEFLRTLPIDELGIQPLLLKGPFYCKKCNMIATENTCGHSKSDRIEISMTFIREKLKEGKINEIPREIIRNEILQIALRYINRNRTD